MNFRLTKIVTQFFRMIVSFELQLFTKIQSNQVILSYIRQCFYLSGLLARILLSFSCYTNGCKILSTTQGSETLGAVNGIRFLSMSWVILGHSYSSLGSFAGKHVPVSGWGECVVCVSRRMPGS